jgi:hypothetical protein
MKKEKFKVNGTARSRFSPSILPFSFFPYHFFVCPRAKMLATKFSTSVALDSL